MASFLKLPEGQAATKGNRLHQGKGQVAPSRPCHLCQWGQFISWAVWTRARGSPVVQAPPSGRWGQGVTRPGSAGGQQRSQGSPSDWARDPGPPCWLRVLRTPVLATGRSRPRGRANPSSLTEPAVKEKPDVFLHFPEIENVTPTAEPRPEPP